jgi:hypothetical protein
MSAYDPKRTFAPSRARLTDRFCQKGAHTGLAQSNIILSETNNQKVPSVTWVTWSPWPGTGKLTVHRHGAHDGHSKDIPKQQEYIWYAKSNLRSP